MKEIIIPFNYQIEGSLSYIEAKEAIAKGEESVVTNCLDFAAFDLLEKGYEVFILIYVKDFKFSNKYIVLSEVLKNNRPYTMKEMRKVHDVSKKIRADGINFLCSVDLEINNFKEEIEIWKNSTKEKTIYDHLSLSVQEYEELMDKEKTKIN
jgi:PHD/YefM family antitoxin component YafN of YafNO toxin-antitoxin module